MKVIDPGHVFDLTWLDFVPNEVYFTPGLYASWNPVNRLIFVKRVGPKYPGNLGAHPGTQTQEVLRALISRTKYVDAQEHDAANGLVIMHLREALWLLENRAALRHLREFHVYTTDGIEDRPTCRKCGHIGCSGSCHP